MVGADTLTAGPETLNIGTAPNIPTTTTAGTPSPNAFVVSASATTVALSATVKRTSNNSVVTDGDVTFTVCTTQTFPCGGTVIGTAIGPFTLNGSGATGSRITASRPTLR